jgi:predicted RNase H-like nuclease (RuvC/YqgF family)
MDDIKDLKRINNQHRLLNADLRQCIKELESELKMGNHLYAELTDKCRELEHDVFMLENKKLGLKSRVDELESELKKAKAQSDTFFEDGIRKAKRIKELEQIGHWLITVSCTCGYPAEEVYAALKGGESND